jgi:hypothetical protein
MFTEPSDLRQFMLAGNAIFTLSNDRTGNRFTYRVQPAYRNNESWGGNTWRVQVLAGPDNLSDYRYLGLLRQFESGALTLYAAAGRRQMDLSVKADPAQAFVWLLRVANGLTTMPEHVQFRHAGRCGRCGRLLTTPESIESGLGPVCAKRATGETA